MAEIDIRDAFALQIDAMICSDTATPPTMQANRFTLPRLTADRQSKSEWLSQTQNDHLIDHSIDIRDIIIDAASGGDRARLMADAAVYGAPHIATLARSAE